MSELNKNARPVSTNDIDALLHDVAHLPVTHARVAALVAERDGLSAELAAAIKQRDEARREVCEADAILGTTAADTANAVARLRGWDCYGQGGGAC